MLRRAFPGQIFRAYPDLGGDLDKPQPDLFREVLAKMPPRNMVVVAVPDQLHFDAIMTALQADQHVCTVKPLVLTAARRRDIEEEALQARAGGRHRVPQALRRPQPDGAAPVPRRPVRRVPPGHRLPAREVVLPPLQFPELVHGGELRRVHLHRLPLRGPGAFHHRPAAGGGERLRHPATSIRTARKATSGPTRASSGTTARA